MAYDEEVYEKLMKDFKLLCNIIRQDTTGQGMKVDLSKVDEVINKKIPDTLKKNAPENFYELYSDFKSEYEKFRDFILYDKLIGKNIVALGGGFSSGKSSFLNVLMEQRVLPENIDPSTSVPTYIVRGEKHELSGINVFDTRVSIELRDIKKIAHGFGEIEDDDGEKITDETTLGHVLESIFLSTPLHKYDHIAFLDTPGYSKPDSEQYSAKTDEQIARRQLNSANYILWFIDADRGTITEEDIKFIKTLREDTPKLMILTKADKKNLKDLQEIVVQVKSSLNLKGIRFVDVFSFTSKIEQVADKKLRKYIETDQKKIKEQVEEWDRQIYEANFAWNFKKLFTDCKHFYEDEIEEESRKLNGLNYSLTKLQGEDVDPKISEPLVAMRRDAGKNVDELKEIRNKLKDLQNEFFTEIKFIADIVGIGMPEPSEIDLLQDKVQNPLQMIEEYKKKKGIKTDKTIVDMLENIFDGVEPVINKVPGGSEYQQELLDVMMQVCNLKPEEIHIHDALCQVKEYQALLESV